MHPANADALALSFPGPLSARVTPMLRVFRLLTASLALLLASTSLAVAGGGEADLATDDERLLCLGAVGVQCQHTHCNQWGCNTFTCLQYVNLGPRHPGLGDCTHTT